jgi:hypothetical protein
MSDEEEKKEESGDEGNADEKRAKDVTMVPSYTSEDLTAEEKKEKFKGLGRTTKKNDGKIIRDDDDEDVKVEKEIYWKLIDLFGGFKYMIYGYMISGFLCYLELKKDYVIADWSNNFELQRTKYG